MEKYMSSKKSQKEQMNMGSEDVNEDLLVWKMKILVRRLIVE